MVIKYLEFRYPLAFLFINCTILFIPSVRHDVVSKIADQSAPFLFGVSLSWHAFLVTGGCEAHETMWKRMEPWSVQSARETDAMEKLTLNHRKDRENKQVKTGWYTWAKMAWNPAIPVEGWNGKQTKWFSVY